jgi:threonine dehydrogenase-like Zn-dependent dehydrogenase
MKAITVVPQTTNVELKSVAEPAIISANEIKMRVWEVGICGTDREEAEGGRAEAPAGKKDLVMGHEMFGQVMETGAAVQSAGVGDYGVFTVRRGCGQCAACLKNRSDLCLSGNYTERGIKGADGYQAQFVVDHEQFFVKVPSEIINIGVLTEPMSVAAKAIDEAVIIQSARLQDILSGKNWLTGKKALVAGLGPIGLMAAFALRLHGAHVTGLDIVDADSLRVDLLKRIGGNYIDGRNVKTTDIDEAFGEFDFVFEATGIEKLQFQLIDTLGPNGIYVATGISGADRPLTMNAGELMNQLVLKNQVVLGSVNASIAHYKMAVDYLQQSQQQWPDVITKVITRRVPYSSFQRSLFAHDSEDIKLVVEWT